MGKEDVKILGVWASPFVMRPRIALNLKHVEYEFLVENMSSKSELLLKSNPVHKMIPVMIHHGKPICESLIIVQYIDEAWPSGPSILPSDPVDRATARFWGAYFEEKFIPAFRGINAAPDEEARKAAAEKLGEVLLVLEDAYTKLSNGAPFFGGDFIGYVDIVFGSYLGWIRGLSKLDGLNLLDGSKFPGLVKWADNFCSDPAVKDVMPETDKIVEFAKGVRERMRAAVPPK